MKTRRVVTTLILGLGLLSLPGRPVLATSHVTPSQPSVVYFRGGGRIHAPPELSTARMSAIPLSRESKLKLLTGGAQGVPRMEGVSTSTYLRLTLEHMYDARGVMAFSYPTSVNYRTARFEGKGLNEVLHFHLIHPPTGRYLIEILVDTLGPRTFNITDPGAAPGSQPLQTITVGARYGQPIPIILDVTSHGWHLFNIHCTTGSWDFHSVEVTRLQ